MYNYDGPWRTSVAAPGALFAPKRQNNIVNNNRRTEVQVALLFKAVPLDQKTQQH